MAMKGPLTKLVFFAVFVVLPWQGLAQVRDIPFNGDPSNSRRLPATDKSAAPPSIDDFLKTRRITNMLGAGPELSPDGELVAYTVGGAKLEPIPNTKFTSSGLSQYNTIYTSQIWITSITSGETRKLTQSSGQSWSPVWSPDGQSLAFFSDRDGLARIWLWRRQDQSVRRVSDVIVRPVFAYQSPRWSPDGQHIVARVLHPGVPITGYLAGSERTGEPIKSESRTSQSGIKVFEWPNGSQTSSQASTAGQRVEKLDYTDRYFADLALVEVATGRSQLIAEAVFPSGYWFNPQGDLLAYLSKPAQEASNPVRSRFDLIVVSLKSGESHLVATDVEQDLNFRAVSWSPDGKRLAFLDRNGKVYIVSATGEAKRISDKSGLSSSFFRAPLWDRAGQYVYCAGQDTVWRINTNGGHVTKAASVSGKIILDIPSPKDSGRFWSPHDAEDSMILATQDQDSRKMGFYSIDLTSGDSSRLLEDSRVIGNFYSISFQVAISKDANHVAFTSEDAQHPQDIWYADAAFKEMRQITHVNPELEAHVFGASRVIEWSDSDGRKLRGALLLPAGYEEGKRYPLVVHVYGGDSASRQANFFNTVDLQMLATRGYAVLLPDAPFSGKGTPMYDLAQTVLPGVNRAVELGIADPNRLAVMGQSFGGYSTLALVVQTNRFKAAIVHAGVGDLISHYGFLRKVGEDFIGGQYETGYVGLGGTPWNARQKYIENSPVFYLDRVETPILLTHGTDDDGVPVSQAEEVFVGLRRLGKTVTLVEYEGEGHGLGKRQNIIDSWERIFKWLEKYLGTQPKDRTSQDK